MIEQRLREASSRWFPPTPSLAAEVRARLPAVPEKAAPRLRRPAVVAFAVLAFAGTAVAASWLEFVPGVRVQRVDDLPEVGMTMPFFGRETSVETLRGQLRFELVLPARLGDPDSLYLDRDREGAPVVTALYGLDDSPRLLLTQWPATVILFDKLRDHYTRSEYVDVDGARGIWIEGGDHAVFYLGRAAASEDRVGGHLAGNVLIWHRGQISYRLELGGTRDEALELADSLRPPE